MNTTHEFFIDLTPKNSSPIFTYDNFESELLPNTQNKTHNSNNISITQALSTTFVENSQSIALSNANICISGTKSRFKFTIIKNKNNNNTTLNSASSRTSKKFNIIRIPQQMNQLYSSKNYKDQNDDIKHFIDSPKLQANDDVIILF